MNIPISAEIANIVKEVSLALYWLPSSVHLWQHAQNE